MAKGLHDSLEALTEKFGAEEVLKAARAQITKAHAQNVCTILVNEGLHAFPDHLFIGERYTVYKGSLQLGSEKELNAYVKKCIRQLGKFLRKKKWRQVYLIISGHAAMSMQVKLAVYRVTRIETIDWVFDGAGNYYQLRLPLRETLFSETNRD